MKPLLAPILALTLLGGFGCATGPRVGDHFETLSPVTVFQDLATYEQALVPGRERFDRATVDAMLSSAQAFRIPIGTTGEIVGLHIPSPPDTASGDLDGGHLPAADVRFDTPARAGVIRVDESIRITKPGK